MCLGRHADPDQFLVPFKRDIDFLTSKGLIEEIQYYRLDIADELEQNPDAKSALQQGHDEIRRGLETHRKGQLFKPAPPNISAAYGIKTGMDVTFIYGVISPIYGVHAWLHPG
jgi:hypothetical protein